MQTDFAVRGKEKQMDDFILRKAALDSLCSGCEYVPIEEKENCPYRFTGCQEYANIFAIPAADVRPVVLCQDCDYWNEWDSSGKKSLGNYRCSCAYWSVEDGPIFYTAETDFCSYAEKREIEHD